MTRALRILLVANDGFSAGHVVRTLAIARSLARGAVRRGLELTTMLVTTSEADALLAGEPLAVVRLPAPMRARQAGLVDTERRRVVGAAIAAVVDSFAPDLIVVDTFPAGPHGELAGLGRRARRALVRRAVPNDGADLLSSHLGDYDLAIVADDAGESACGAPIRQVRVPPITLGDARDGLDRTSARRALGLPAHGRALLVAAGGGGDGEAAVRARAIADALVAIDPAITVALALGPLAARRDEATARHSHELTIAPLQPYLAAFDGAFAPAGYNTAHELAAARVPAALFAQPRPFDDQAARARRLAALGFAHELADFVPDAIARAARWLDGARCPALATGGADGAADALYELVGADTRSDGHGARP